MKTHSFLRQGFALLIAFTLLSSSSKNENLPPAVSPILSSPDAKRGSTTVTMQDMQFHPYELKISEGETVTWINMDDIVYSVTADDGSFESGDIQPGGSYTRTFSTVGVINYHSRHGFEMVGKIIVNEAGSK